MGYPTLDAPHFVQGDPFPNLQLEITGGEEVIYIAYIFMDDDADNVIQLQASEALRRTGDCV